MIQRVPGNDLAFDIYQRDGGGPSLYGNVDWGLIEGGDDDEANPAIQRPLQAAELPSVQRTPAPLAPQQSTRSEELSRERRTETRELVDPLESVRTFAALLADSLDTDASTLLDPRTGIFRPRVMGLLEKCRREIIQEARAPQTVTLQALIYDNPQNDTVRVWFSELVKYRVLRESPGNAFIGNVMESRAVGGQAPGQFRATYRIASNHRNRRLQARGYRHYLQRFSTIYWAPNPVILEYMLVRLDALARAERLMGNVEEAVILEREVRPLIVNGPRSAQTADLIRLLNEKQAPFEEGYSTEEEEETGFIPLGATAKIGAVVTRENDVRMRRLLETARQARRAVQRLRELMPYVLMPGFSDEPDGYSTGAFI